MTNINNNYENNQKFYQFLQLNQGWEDEMAGQDGIISRAEFEKFFDVHKFDFSSLEGKKDDLINNFWKSMNINSSSAYADASKLRQSGALDAKEQEAMINRIEADERLTEFVANLDIPSFVKDETGCKKQIFSKLMDLVEANILKKYKNLDDLDKLLDTNIKAVQNAAVADTYVNECLEENMSKISKEYGYAYGSDTTLQGMIISLVKKVTAETTESEIQTAIDDLVKGYLATAGLGDGKIPEAVEGATGLTAASVWYNPANGSALNDLQKAVVETNLNKAKPAILKEYGANYEHYKSLYDTAFAEFVEETLKNTKFGDFSKAKGFGKAEFEATEIYKNLEKTVKVKNLMRGYEKVSGSETSMIAKALSDAGLPQTLIDRVTKEEDRCVFGILDTIENDLITRVLNDEFGQDIENLSIEDILKDAASQIRKNIKEFYPGGLGDQTLTELKQIYTVMDKVGEEQEDSEQALAEQRNAAVLFCDAVANKNSKFKETVQLVLGEDYSAKLNQLIPSEITELMKNLIAKLDELGDASTFKLGANAWGNFDYGTTTTYNLDEVRASAQKYLDDNGIRARVQKQISQGLPGFLRKIGDTKQAMGSYLECLALSAEIQLIDNSHDPQTIIRALNKIKDMKDFGGVLEGLNRPEWNPPCNVTANAVLNMRANATKSFNITPEFTNDGNAQYVSTDRISYKCSNEHVSVDANGNVTVLAGAQVGDFDTTVQILVDGIVVGEKTFRISVAPDTADVWSCQAQFAGQSIESHVRSGHVALQLSGFANWDQAKANAKYSINNYVDQIAQSFKDAGYVSDHVDRAANTLKNYYNAVIDAMGDVCFSSGSCRYSNIHVDFVDGNGNPRSADTRFEQNTHEYEKDAGRTGVGASNIDHNSCGIRMNESYSGSNTYEYYINTAVLLKKFQEFYNSL